MLSQFGESRALARENYKRFVLDGVGRRLDVWSGLNGQIFLGNKDFVSEMQDKIANNASDWDIPKKQKRPVAMSLLQIEEQHSDRNSAIVTAYKTGAYSQREVAEHFRLHPSTVGVIVRKAKDSQFGTCPLVVPQFGV